MRRIAVGLAGVLLFCGSVLALGPEQLKQMLDQGDAVTVIDVRNSYQYTQGHIAGAINIPAAVIGQKRLPALGQVVVCGDGIRRDIAVKAVAELNAKAGIRAQLLEGGLAGWEAQNYATTRERGLSPSRVRHVSYAELQAAAAGNPDMVLVDLRGLGQGAEQPERSDLGQRFAGRRVIRVQRGRGTRSDSPDVSAVIAGGRQNARGHLYVLIDDGDGQAEKMARRLHAAGVRRVAVLTGGQLSLQRQGRSELVTKQSEKKQP